MILQDFICIYDQPDSIVLLEGKRAVAEEDKEKLYRLGALLAKQTKYMTFRSGNAAGADYYFSVGVAEIDNRRLEVIIPYPGHHTKLNNATKTISVDEIDLADEPEVISLSKSNKKTSNLIDKYLSGARDRFAIKAAYIIRDTIKVTGTKGGVTPATFGLFYDDLDNPRSGGTGHTMLVCESRGVGLLDQKTWMGWIE